MSGRRELFGKLLGRRSQDGAAEAPLAPMPEDEVRARLEALSIGEIEASKPPSYLGELLGKGSAAPMDARGPGSQRGRRLPVLPIVRPPGAIDEARFVERCDGCGMSRSSRRPFVLIHARMSVHCRYRYARMQHEDVRRYLGETKEVQGWFFPVDAYLFGLIDEIQRREDLRGHLFEIGVHHGKTAIFLARMARAGELLGVCDVFGQQELNRDHSGEGSRDVACR